MWFVEYGDLFLEKNVFEQNYWVFGMKNIRENLWKKSGFYPNTIFENRIRVLLGLILLGKMIGKKDGILRENRNVLYITQI